MSAQFQRRWAGERFSTIGDRQLSAAMRSFRFSSRPIAEKGIMFRKTWKFAGSQPGDKRKSRRQDAGVFILCLAMVFAVLNASAAPRKASLINKPAPPFARTSVKNERVDLGALRGRVIVLNFWATW